MTHPTTAMEAFKEARKARHLAFYPYDGSKSKQKADQAAAAVLEAWKDEQVRELREALRQAEERGAQAIIAYHVAICSPKGVVPMDDFYDPQIAAKIERDMVHARHLLAGERGA